MDHRYAAHSHEASFLIRELSLFGRILEFLFGDHFTVRDEESEEDRYYSIAFKCGKNYHYLHVGTTDPNLVQQIVERYLILQKDENTFNQDWVQELKLESKVHIICGKQNMFDREPACVYYASVDEAFVNSVVRSYAKPTNANK
jgi:hypothetical protein